MSSAQTSDQQNMEIVRQIATEMAAMPGALLPILHAVQDRLGHVPPATIPVIGEILRLSRAEVHGVISFYHLIRSSAPGAKTLYLCRAEACQSMGARQLEQLAKEELGIDFHQTTDDGRLSLEPVYCLGNCACAPSVMLDEEVHGRVTPERLKDLIAGESA